MNAPRSHAFKPEAAKALDDHDLQHALSKIQDLLVGGRRRAVDALPEFGALRDAGAAIKDHTIVHLDLYLERFADEVEKLGGHVHFAATDKDACDAVLKICRDAGARTVAKSKSMVTEEIGLNAALEGAGIRPVETDLGEYIIQLRHEQPSHIIAPAVHLGRAQIEEAFRDNHRNLPDGRKIDEPAELLAEARTVLRSQFLAADVGITGANFLVAESGSAFVVTNEGNADLSMTLPDTHIVLTGIEKLVPTLDDALVMLRLLVRSATGQPATGYTTLITGPRREGDLDGPRNFHVVLVDNGRSRLLGSRNQAMLRCIRCSACMNHCPVYGAVGGHAYGWVYPGPMGSVLTPNFVGLHEARDLPNASTFCGRCESVCPVKIPLPQLMRNLREEQFEAGDVASSQRWALRLWAAFATRPRLYRMASRLGARVLRQAGGRRSKLAKVPLAEGWTAHRDLPAPEGKTFTEQWKRGVR
ncbi:L-lactate dehydrogenase complex protein LldF [Faunimonas pinastri]|uniref:L-lactate dehydrogenase complex protein LldF n=1 Tax=Faunimonas pinastri TaxID=1855383 RepID=A0A1H8ZCX0_9HYPH|nr:LutB/LldF family L-lactate oxidation iron-sulfur protein [Faunimonas pinastri]SEP62246.1 L-lactate dehydrogenase complex protein LldF [Faunimonas pinastri]